MNDDVRRLLVRLPGPRVALGRRHAQLLWGLTVAIVAIGHLGLVSPVLGENAKLDAARATEDRRASCFRGLKADEKMTRAAIAALTHELQSIRQDTHDPTLLANEFSQEETAIRDRHGITFGKWEYTVATPTPAPSPTSNPVTIPLGAPTPIPLDKIIAQRVDGSIRPINTYTITFHGRSRDLLKAFADFSASPLLVDVANPILGTGDTSAASGQGAPNPTPAPSAPIGIGASVPLDVALTTTMTLYDVNIAPATPAPVREDVCK